MEKSTIVVFRKWPAGDILALFPTLDEGRGHCLSYAHIGQHGAADYHGCIRVTQPATEEEYAQLLEEIRVRRIQPKG